MKKAVYVFSSGELHRKQNTLYLETPEGKKYLPVENTGEIYVFGEVSINKKLLEFLCESEIILHFFNHYGYYVGSFYPREHYNSGHIILKQAEFYLDPARRMTLARTFVAGAVENIRKVLAYYANREVQLADIQEGIENLAAKIETQERAEQLMAYEGNIREYYYRAFDRILNNPDFTFEKRTRQPPRNQL
ncbi:MAG: CRISPR-associated endonuclease Cas1, partial [candidate division WOR-3 bacterium]